MKTFISTIGVASALLIGSVLQDAIAQPQASLKLRMSPSLVRLNAKGEADLTIEAMNVSNKSITLTLRPERGQNLTLNVFENGQYLKALVEGKLVEPEMATLGGVQPGYPYQKDEALTLSPGKSKSFKIQLSTEPFDRKVMTLKPGKIYIDGPSPWGKTLCRDLWSLPFKSNEVTVRFVYKQGGLSASSNDVVVRK